jgi:dTDP-4-amino-4,6-dideoxygalactose transaminase
LPQPPQWAEPVWHLYVVRTHRRAELQKALDAAGIGSLVHYPIPPHLQQAYADLGLPRGSFPRAEALADSVLSLPIGPHMSPEAIDSVADVVRRAALSQG